jgi:biotin carboxyl carrier protein
MKYRVHLDNQEWDVDVDGDRVRIGGEEAIVRSGSSGGEIEVSFRGHVLRLRPLPSGVSGNVAALLDGKIVEARVESEADRLRAHLPATVRGRRVDTLRSDIPGVIRQLLKQPGEEVSAGDPVLTLEAMKMENEVCTEIDGSVLEIRVEVGQAVGAGDVLGVIEPRKP